MEESGHAGGNSAKRNRDEQEEAPQAKRIRAADLILLDILDDVEGVDRDAVAHADGELASVIRSFEEEIASFSLPRERPHQPAGAAAKTPAPASEAEAEVRRGSDLGYLLEASDDELGLPPSVVPSSSDEGEGADGDVVDGGQGTAGIGQIWGLEDEIPSCYDALDLGVFGQDGGVAFDGVLFDYAGVASFGPSDYSDFSWERESLSAV